MTKEEALKITAELWDWLVANPGAEKSDWEGWDRYGDMRGDCPLCEYTYASNSHANCRLCPLYGKWGRSSKESMLCNQPYGLYHLWCVTVEADKSAEYARQIAERCREALRELQNEKVEVEDGLAG